MREMSLQPIRTTVKRIASHKGPAQLPITGIGGEEAAPAWNSASVRQTTHPCYNSLLFLSGGHFQHHDTVRRNRRAIAIGKRAQIGMRP